LHAEVSAIIPSQSLIQLQDGTQIPYKCLLIATGAQAARMDIPGIDLNGVVKLDNIDDVRQIRKLARRGKRAVVIGGGITALEIVEGLVANKVITHYFLRGKRYWSNVLDDTESRIVEHRLKDEGVKIHYQTSLERIFGKRGQITGVRTQSGRDIKCDLLAYAIGIRPRVELARACGLEIDRGIIVNQLQQTSQPTIYAAGDVAQVYDPITGNYVIDSLWGLAREQGWIAGLNMAGANQAYMRGTPFNVTRLANLTTTIVGTVGKGQDDDLRGIARGDSEVWRQLPDAIAVQSDFDVNHIRLILGDNTLLGSIIMGDQTLSQPLRELINNNVPITSIREKLLEPNAPLSDLIIDHWTHWKSSHAN
jgi:NAD(P)H-nitrite reductase large subunit